MPGRGHAGQAGPVSARCGSSWSGGERSAGMFWRRKVWRVAARRVSAGPARCCVSCCGRARQASPFGSWQSGEWLVQLRRGSLRQAWHSRERNGAAVQGQVWQARRDAARGWRGQARLVRSGHGRRGSAGTGKSRLGRAGMGLVRQAWFGSAWLGLSWLAEASPGLVW